MPSALPRLVVLISHLRLNKSPSRLAGAVAAAAKPYAARAEIRIVDCDFDESLQLAKALQREERTDVLISAGATGDYLRQQLDMPVVLMRNNGMDLLRAVADARARAANRRVVVLTYREIDADLEDLLGVLKMDVEPATYSTLRQAERRVAEAKRAGCGAVVGSSMVTEIAEAAGLPGFLAIGAQATRVALDDAIALHQTAQIQSDRRRWLDAVLRSLHDGMLALDHAGRVQSINGVMASLLGFDADAVLGRDISTLELPQEMRELLTGGREVRNQVLPLQRKQVVANVMPLPDFGEGPGVVLTVQETASVRQAERRIRSTERRTQAGARHRLDDIAGRSGPILRALSTATAYAQASATVLIVGESGTGKELFAQGIHNASARRLGPFVAVNCGAFPESLLESELFGHEEGAFTGSRRGGKAGLFEAAHRGTLFLDEIGDMPLTLQTRLLRVLQEREVTRLGSTEPTRIDVRVMAATHRDLAELVRTGRFRQDLFYRIAILPLHVPPLRDRIEDLAPIALRILGNMPNIAPKDAQAFLDSLRPGLLRHHWPGNVRELENVLERAVLLRDAGADAPIDADALGLTPASDAKAPARPSIDAKDPAPHSGEPAGTTLRKLGRSTEERHARRVLEACGGSMKQAAAALGISRSTLWRRLKEADWPGGS
jgi:transcriptional regulator, propionate catabolism operon regulatory protein